MKGRTSRRQLLTIATISFVLPAAGATVVACKKPVTVTVYLVRHAEKTAGEGKDPDLSPKGKLRAAALVQSLDGVTLSAIYASQFKRTQQTVAAVAQAKSMKVETVDAGDMEALLGKIQSHEGGAVLVAGHSNTVPEIAKKLGAANVPALAEADYGDLFVVDVKAGKAALTRSKFGVV